MNLKNLSIAGLFLGSLISISLFLGGNYLLEKRYILGYGSTTDAGFNLATLGVLIFPMVIMAFRFFSRTPTKFVRQDIYAISLLSGLYFLWGIYRFITSGDCCEFYHWNDWQLLYYSFLCCIPPFLFILSLGISTFTYSPKGSK
jgi:hypothetical protein